MTITPAAIVPVVSVVLAAGERTSLADEAMPAVQERLASISARRVLADVEKLASFGTRHTLSTTDDPARGIGAARNWLLRELRASCGEAHAALESFDAPPSVRLPDGAVVANVVGVIPGTMPAARDRAYYVVGHYDSRNAEALDAAGDSPGANDDASGVAVVLECARALAGSPCESTVVFLCTAGEEQGLIGARFHAQNLSANKSYRLVQVLNHDIVGDPGPAFIQAHDGTTQDASRFVRVFSEGVARSANAELLARIRAEGAESDSPSRQLARFIAYVARRERTRIQPMLVFRQDRFLRGGDHAAFNEAGFAGVRFTAPAEDYSRQHQNVTTDSSGAPYGDVARFVSGEYVADVARLNLATLMHLANAPSPPARARMITAELATDTLLRWDTSPEPDTKGYEVVYRLTTDADWTGVIDAGNATELRTPMSKDNFFFGVRAYDADGYRSPVSFAWAARE